MDGAMDVGHAGEEDASRLTIIVAHFEGALP